MSALAVVQEALSRRGAAAGCPRYAGALERALRDEPLAIGTGLYAEMFGAASADAQWLVLSLLSCAQQAGDMARRSWGLSGASTGTDEGLLLLRRAVDGSRHVIAYLELVDLCFPEALEPGFRSELEALSPRYTTRRRPAPGERSAGLDDVIQSNVEAIRSLMLLRMQRPALSKHCSADRWLRAEKRLDRLSEDGLANVAATAELIERRGGEALLGSLRRGLYRLNRSTSEEPIDYSYHLRFGNYP